LVINFSYTAESENRIFARYNQAQTCVHGWEYSPSQFRWSSPAWGGCRACGCGRLRQIFKGTGYHVRL